MSNTQKMTTKEAPKAYVEILTACPLCSSKNTRPIKSEQNRFNGTEHPEVLAFDKAWLQLLQCRECTFAFTKEIPTSPTFFQNRYDNTWFDTEQEITAIRKNLILEDLFGTLAKYGCSKGKLLDIGSFAGQLLRYSETKGFTPHGAELNPKMATFTKDKLGYDVFLGEFQTLSLENQNFDVITIVDVLEHLQNPKGVLKNIASGLKPGGYLFIKVPNPTMQIVKQNIANLLRISKEGVFAHFGHLNHFTLKSLKRALLDVGLELVEVQAARSEYWFNKKAFHGIRNFIRWSYWKISQLVYKIFGISLALNHNFIAKKPESHLSS